MGDSDFLIATSQFVDAFYLVRVVFIFLYERYGTHWLILLTSTFFWIVSFVSCLFFFTLSFSFWSCCRSSYTLFSMASFCSRCFFTSFFSFITDNSGFIRVDSLIVIFNLLSPPNQSLSQVKPTLSTKIPLWRWKWLIFTQYNIQWKLSFSLHFSLYSSSFSQLILIN